MLNDACFTVGMTNNAETTETTYEDQEAAEVAAEELDEQDPFTEHEIAFVSDGQGEGRWIILPIAREFPHGDVLDMRDLLDDADARPFLIASMIEDGLASDAEDVEHYAENEPTLVAEKYFPEYAEELANDLGLVSESADWPARHIDWEAAARELAFDYSTVDIDRRTYYVRAF